MFVMYLTNPTVHLLRSIECYGGEALKFHYSKEQTDVVVKIPDSWMDMPRDKADRFVMPTPYGQMHVKEIKPTKHKPTITVLDEV